MVFRTDIDTGVWTLLCKPGQDIPLCTSFTKAREWMEEHERQGRRARLVELVEETRGAGYRPHRYKEDELEKKTGVLPGLDAGFRDRVK